MTELISARPAEGSYDRVLGLDLDGVCSDYVAGLRAFMTSDLGLAPETMPEPINYNLARAGWPFKNVEQYLEVHRSAVLAGLYADLPVYENLKLALNRLSSSGVHIRIVTHRLFIGGLHERIITDTVRWLDNNELPYMSLCFTGLKDSVGADAYVEDSPAAVESLRAAGYPVIVFDQLYNQGVSGPRMTDWTGGVDKILTMLYENPTSPSS
ncbi:hypothetical protein [Cryobacterium sp. MDB2-33-2]|uniref:5' nucleotidase, NT5C type n=1 Tax=Cryobacterium sp. MDB2-33-2 TaxID=1259179 RepID=UPI00106BA0A1|nr:hypothetical protein [Cryobacterium sp. MDB2-33-2]TFC05059.1 hypothetical protein E3O59_13045 [Cryobacterium sp. MDB2-33-2]